MHKYCGRTSRSLLNSFSACLRSSMSITVSCPRATPRGVQFLLGGACHPLLAHLNTCRRPKPIPYACSHLPDYTNCRESPPFTHTKLRKFRPQCWQHDCRLNTIRSEPKIRGLAYSAAPQA